VQHYEDYGNFNRSVNALTMLISTS